MVQSFEKAWKQVEAEYQKGQVCSERHLQAIIYHHLMSDINFVRHYNIKVEPKIFDKYKSLGKYGVVGTIPDMIITKAEEILAVVEIKYVPHHYISFEKDMSTLTKFWSLRKDRNARLLLDVVPQTGEWDDKKEYKVHEDVYIIYCAIGNTKSHLFQIENDNVVGDWLTNDINYLLFSGSICFEEQLFSFTKKRK